MQNSAKRRGVSLLLIVGLLIVALAVIIPLAIAADGPAIQDFSFQLLSDANIGDETTDARCLFKIGSLSYDEVGFIFSKTVTTPEYGAANCATKKIYTVFSSIIASGTPVNAGDGLYWVAVKLTDIPRDYFGGPIYVRPFVKSGESVQYDDTKVLNICRTLGEEWKYTTSTSTNHNKSVSLSTVLNGGHFYPDGSNGNKGQDYIVEYSFLWNDTLKNLSTKDAAGNDNKYSQVLSSEMNKKAFLWMALKDNAKGCDGHFGGGFEYTDCMQTVEYGPAGMSKNNSGTIDGNTFANFPNIGGPVQASPEYGWHRLALVYHEALMNEDALKADNVAGTTPAQYLIEYSCYIDGELIFIHSNRANANFHASDSVQNIDLLFTATSDGNNGITYADNNLTFKPLKINPVRTDSGSAYAVYADYSVHAARHSAVPGFAQNVEKVDTPAVATYITSDGNSINAPFYYKLAPTLSEPTVYDSGNEQDQDFNVVSSLRDARGTDHFYPDSTNGGEGRDLYFDMDILWNETITSNWIDGNGIRIELVNYDSTPARDNLFLLNPKQNTWGSSDAKASGGFDYGGAATHAIVYGPKGVNGTGTNAENFPNIGAYGWHRIGVRVHEEAAVSGNGVAYTIYSTLYIDGAKIWQIKYTGNFTKWLDRGIMLFTATNEGGNLVYTDASSKLNLEFSGWDSADGDGVYVPYCNVRMRAVDVDFNPSSEIEPAGSPIAASVDLGSYDPALVHYQLVP